jgi:hypothetical protein
MINILIVSHEPLTPSLKSMYCIDDLKLKFNVEYLSLRCFFYKKNEFKFNDELTNEFKDFSSIFLFYRYLAKFKTNNTYVFLENSTIHLSALLVNYILKDFKICRYILYRSYLSNNSLISKKNISEKLLSLFNKNYFKSYIINKLSNINYTLVFASGLEKPLVRLKEFIPLNSTILSEKIINTDVINSNYVVFIDQGYPSHPDLIKKGYQSNSELNFVASYNIFFDYIEKKYSTKVIIAKHPKSSINNNYFAGREVIVNKTKELILNSKFVIAHSSLINLFAVYNYKKILLIYNAELKLFPSNLYTHMKEFSEMLDLDMINIEDKTNYSKIDLSLNKLKYELFIKKYINIRNLPNYKIIEDAILLDLNNTSV